MSNFTELPQERISGSINGFRYGGRPRVLARTQDHILVWIPGYTSYVNRMVGNKYSSAAMVLFERRVHAARGAIEICQGERIGPAVFAKYADAIDRHLGEGFHALLDPNKTIVVGDNQPFSIYGHEIPASPRSFGYERMMREIDVREKLVAQGMTGLTLEMTVLKMASETD